MDRHLKGSLGSSVKPHKATASLVYLISHLDFHCSMPCFQHLSERSVWGLPFISPDTLWLRRARMVEGKTGQTSLLLWCVLLSGHFLLLTWEMNIWWEGLLLEGAGRGREREARAHCSKCWLGGGEPCRPTTAHILFPQYWKLPFLLNAPARLILLFYTFL